jgi:hypothetical protein
VKRLAPLAAAVIAATVAFSLAAPVLAGAEAPLHPFSREGSTAALKERIAEQFPGAVIPPQEGILCSPGEHSMNGPISYCNAEFTTEGTWNLVGASRLLSAVAEPGGASVTIYAHATWRREWRRCKLGRETPGVLFSNENCGLQHLESLMRTDAEMVEFEVLPKLRSGKPIRFVDRDGLLPISLFRFRATRRNGVYTFTNPVGDSFRYTPPRQLNGSP